MTLNTSSARPTYWSLAELAQRKESRYWLRPIEAPDPGVDGERESLVQEAQELMNIFGSIVRKSE